MKGAISRRSPGPRESSKHASTSRARAALKPTSSTSEVGCAAQEPSWHLAPSLPRSRGKKRIPRGDANTWRGWSPRSRLLQLGPHSRRQSRLDQRRSCGNGRTRHDITRQIRRDHRRRGRNRPSPLPAFRRRGRHESAQSTVARPSAISRPNSQEKGFSPPRQSLTSAIRLRSQRLSNG